MRCKSKRCKYYKTYSDYRQALDAELNINMPSICYYCKRTSNDNFESVIASTSAKPGQAHIPASPCPAYTHTPSRHPGAKDSEVRKHKLSEELE